MWVATAPDLAKVSGQFFEGHREKNGRYRDQVALDDLDRQPDAITGTPLAAAAV